MDSQSPDDPIDIHSSSSEDQLNDEPLTEILYFSNSDQTRVKRKGVGRFGGGARQQSKTWSLNQSLNLRQAVIDRPACSHLVLIHYPKEIKQVSQEEFAIHMDRFLRRLRLLHPKVEYVWAREWNKPKLTPHLHVCLSVMVEPRVLRELWVLALKATHPKTASTVRSPYVGYTRKEWTLKGRACYMAKLRVHNGKLRPWGKRFKQKFPPDGVEFTSGGSWGASRVRGVLRYRGTTEEMAKRVRTVNLVAKSIERKKGLKKGKLKTTNRKGAKLFDSGAILQSMRADGHLWGIKEAKTLGTIGIQGIANGTAGLKNQSAIPFGPGLRGFKRLKQTHE